MNNRVIVFDFDKTLTYKDTLLGFFLYCSSKNLLFPFKVFCFFFLMVCAKLKMTSNFKLKEYGIRFFLYGQHRSNIHKKSSEYAKKISFNDLFKNFNFNTDLAIYVSSASFEEYLKMIFPDNVKILASQLTYDNDRVSGLKFNCYRENKKRVLAEKDVHEIDVLYTDSYNDYSLAMISKKIMIVKKDRLIELNNIESFNAYFGK